MSRVELKSYKEYKTRSEETVNFTAAVYVDGKKVGEVENDGRGGPHRWQPWGAEEIVGKIAKAMPKYAEFNQEQADCLINDLGFAITLSKDIAKDLKTCFAFTDADGKYRVTGKVTPAQRVAFNTQPEWTAKMLVKLGGTKWIRTPEEGVAVVLAYHEARRTQS